MRVTNEHTEAGLGGLAETQGKSRSANVDSIQQIAHLDLDDSIRNNLRIRLYSFGLQGKQLSVLNGGGRMLGQRHHFHWLEPFYALVYLLKVGANHGQ